MPKCEECRFFDANPPSDIRKSGSRAALYGACHRWPPTVIVTTDPNGGTHVSQRWPAVGKEDWCGEFASRA